MKLIKEPLEADFEADPVPLTKAEEKAISNFICEDKKSANRRNQEKNSFSPKNKTTRLTSGLLLSLTI